MDNHLLENELYDEEDTIENQYLFFLVDEEIYAIRLEHVHEIIGLQEITHVPKLPPYMKGIINVRGNIIPVMDLRIRFQKPILEYTGRTSIVIIRFEETTIGLIVDRALEVGEVLSEEILEPPDLVRGYHNDFVSGINLKDEKIRLLIDCEKLLTKTDVDQINASL